MFSTYSFRTVNRLTGWLVGITAMIVYSFSIEPTASFWDCSEYIACANKLEIGHPPGAPFFLLLGRFFSMFTGGDGVAVAINLMSALASAFTVQLLFLSITHLARKILLTDPEHASQVRMVLILVAGAVGALTFAFTDSFWFSAVEGEVYALSSFFTAVVFYAMLRWEESSEDTRGDRWIVFIAYMIGLSIGVHLLNLLTIPALVFIWFQKKYPRYTVKQLVIASIAAVVLLGGIQDFLIPGIVSGAGAAELFFVNKVGMPFQSGTIIYFALIITGIVFGLWWSHRKQLHYLNIGVLSFAMLLIGYSTFLVVIIRSNAGTPINENRPNDAVSLLSYLNREQYGDWPIFHGQQYSTPLDPEQPYVDGQPKFVRDNATGKYIISDARKESEYNYDKRATVFLPRMWSSSHAEAYQGWVDVKGDTLILPDSKGRVTTAVIPKFRENLRYFVTYQCGWMYARYFLWNFVGRQNDRTGYGNDMEGNFQSGIGLFDRSRIGEPELMPEFWKNNKASNSYFALPLILGIIGAFWHYYRSRKDALVIALLFIFTGLAIVFYLNQTPWQPRERDYAYVGSFFAFSIWIGLGVIGVYQFFQRFLTSNKSLAAALMTTAVVPVIVLSENYDDHNRKDRTVARDLAINLLQSCAPNAILFTYADNDTFPLWYAQEVLGIRTDVRVVCLSLLGGDWYIDQLKEKYYDSDAIPFSMQHWDYREGTRSYVNVFNERNDTMSVAFAVKRAISKKFEEQFISTTDDTLNYIPGRYLSLPVHRGNAMQHNAVEPYNQQRVEDTIYWSLKGNYILKDQLVILDILANNTWKRPIYFALNMPGNSYAGLDDYLQLEGLAYRLIPVKNFRANGTLRNNPMVHLQRSVQLFSSTFKWGGIHNEHVYADETTARMFTDPMLTGIQHTALALAEAGQYEQAMAVLKKTERAIPLTQIPPDEHWIAFVEIAYRCGDHVFANNLSRKIVKHAYESIQWYTTLPRFPADLSAQMRHITTLEMLAHLYSQESLSLEYQAIMQRLDLIPQRPQQDSADSITD